MLILAILACSVAVSVAHATYTSPANLPWTANSLVTANQLTIAGSSTVGPIASEEINAGGFVNYVDSSAVQANINPTKNTAATITQVNLATLGSGTAVPSLENNGGAIADVGEMSRPSLIRRIRTIIHDKHSAICRRR